MSYDSVSLYHKFVQLQPFNDTQLRGLCPFHKDKVPSFFVNFQTGQWHCFGCSDNSGGGPVKFIQLYFDVSEKIAQYMVDYYKIHGQLCFPTDVEVSKYVQQLNSQPAVLQGLS